MIAIFLPLPSETLATIYIRVIAFQGLLDIGADQSVIPQSLWPKHWETKRETTVQGVGGPQLAKVSAVVPQWEDEEGNSGTFQPFIIIGVQLCLWGKRHNAAIAQDSYHTKSLTLGGGPFPGSTR
jgi:hypothetical protein